MQNGLQSPMLIYDLPNQEVAINLGGPQVPHWQLYEGPNFPELSTISFYLDKVVTRETKGGNNKDMGPKQLALQ